MVNAGPPVGPVVTICPPKDFDVYTAAGVRQEFIKAIDQDGAGVVVANLEHVEYIDNSGLGVLVGALKRAHAHDCQLIVICTAESVLRIFRITGMSKVFDIRENAAGLDGDDTAAAGED
jgi:anti-sigma B factor antagonist